MEQQRKQPAASTAASSPASSGSPSSARSIHGSMSSAFLGVSSSTHSQSQSQFRRSSPSLYPPPAPLPGHLASRSSAAGSGAAVSSSSSSQSQFHQISPSPGAAAKRRSRPKNCITHSLPTPFLSELSSIRRIGTNVFGDLDAIQRPSLHGQQEQEMTRTSSSSLPMPHSHPISIGNFSGSPSASEQQQALAMRGLSGFVTPPLQQQQQQAQPSFSSLHPLPGGDFSRFPLPSLQPPNMQPSSSFTDLPTSGFEAPAALQHLSTYLAPLPSGSTIFQSSSSSSEMYELPPLPESLQMPPLLLQQAMQGPVGVAPCLEPKIISLDDGNELSALVHSFPSSHCHGSTSLPTNLEDMLQLGGSGSGLSMSGAAEGGAQTWEAMLALANKIDMMSIGGSSLEAKMILGGMDTVGLPPLPPVLGTGTSSSKSERGGTKVLYFSDAEIETINKDTRLRELVKTDSRRVKMALRNREYVARQKGQKAKHFQDLRCQADELKMDCMSLSAQVQSHQEMFDNLKTENHEAKIMLEGLKEIDNLKQALNLQLQSELQRLKS